MRAYLTLLRLPYQFQLGPIFLWGAALAHLSARESALDGARVLIVFLLLHIGCFGGLTALNSFYDRDDGPIGGLWNAPAPPSRLLVFAWAVQVAGLAAIFFSVCAPPLFTPRFC